MGKLSIKDAVELAATLSPKGLQIIRDLGRRDIKRIQPEDIDRLVKLKLIENTTNLLNPSEKVWVLTERGKTLRKALTI